MEGKKQNKIWQKKYEVLHLGRYYVLHVSRMGE